jgi:Polysaccharide pyruvyl transferase
MIYKGTYLGWVGFKNLGDEAMYELCRRRFPTIVWSTSGRLDRKIDTGQFFKRDARDLKYVFGVLSDEVLRQPRLRAFAAQGIHHVSRKLGREVAILGGGTLINRNDAALARYIRARTETRSLVPVFGTGVCSPDFWYRERDWSDRRKQWVAATAELPVVGVRGPCSKELLEDAGANNVVICGDPAVAFHLPYSKKQIRERQNESLRIGVNSSDCCGQLWGTPEKIQESLAGLVRWLAERKHRIEFVAVQPQDVTPCLDVARRAGIGQPLIQSVSDARSFLSYLEGLDLLVAVKLHAGILSAAANVPFVLLEYQPKCRDFARSVGWEMFAPRTDHLNESVLIDRVTLLIEQLDSKRQELQGRMRVLMSHFEDYCRQIEPLLHRDGRNGSRHSQRISMASSESSTRPKGMADDESDLRGAGS